MSSSNIGSTEAQLESFAKNSRSLFKTISSDEKEEEAKKIRINAASALMIANRSITTSPINTMSTTSDIANKSAIIDLDLQLADTELKNYFSEHPFPLGGDLNATKDWYSEFHIPTYKECDMQQRSIITSTLVTYLQRSTQKGIKKNGWAKASASYNAQMIICKDKNCPFKVVFGVDGRFLSVGDGCVHFASCTSDVAAAQAFNDHVAFRNTLPPAMYGELLECATRLNERFNLKPKQRREHLQSEFTKLCKDHRIEAQFKNAHVPYEFFTHLLNYGKKNATEGVEPDEQLSALVNYFNKNRVSYAVEHEYGEVDNVVKFITWDCGSQLSSSPYILMSDVTFGLPDPKSGLFLFI